MAQAFAPSVVSARLVTSEPLRSAARPAAHSLRSAARPQQLAVRRRSLTAVRAVTNADKDSFDAEVVDADVPVLVDFWATWCGPCKLVAPSMDWASKTFEGSLKVVKIDSTNDETLMQKYKVYGLPCLMVFKNGEKLADSHREGAITRKDLAKYIEAHVGVTVPAA